MSRPRSLGIASTTNENLINLITDMRIMPFVIGISDKSCRNNSVVGLSAAGGD